ncbi:MAG: ABC transporter ATP-binding protein [Actinomycetota bacterium]|nr:ABC transporter ATP-binding protein [Actinomycetota bacterium]MDQ3575158.1 ABC transporter ATP-binding protein [Actinomycetota bacterium]
MSDGTPAAPATAGEGAEAPEELAPVAEEEPAEQAVSVAEEPAPAAEEEPAPVEETHVIRTVGLTKTYPGGLTAVDSLELTVRKGEIFALLGPNGAGKTTTVGMLTTRVVPTAGTALVNGVDVVADPALAKAAVGVVAQANTLDRSLTVWENLYFHGRYFGFRDRAAKKAADRLLERFRLTGRAKARVTTLSGGMAKRLMLARAFLPRPAVLFLDEPTAGLDPQSRLALWEILGELHAEGETILLTTHYMEEAERLAQRVAIMDRGRILALDTPERLRRSLGTEEMLLLKVDGDLDRLARRLRLVGGVIEVKPADGGLRVLLEEAEGTVAEIVSVVDREGFSLRTLSLEEASLETVFISLTGKELRE